MIAGLAFSVDYVMPRQIIWQVVGVDAFEARDPILQSALMRVDILDVPDPVADALAGGKVDWLMADTVPASASVLRSTIMRHHAALKLPMACCRLSRP